MQMKLFNGKKKAQKLKLVLTPTEIDSVKVTSSKIIYDFIYNFFDPDTFSYDEDFYIAVLNNSNIVKGVVHISKGGITGTVVDIRKIFSAVLLSGCTGFIMIHNHPSGNLLPSDSDIKITKKTKDAAKMMDLILMDHLIVTEYGYYSFGDEGIL